MYRIISGLSALPVTRYPSSPVKKILYPTGCHYVQPDDNSDIRPDTNFYIRLDTNFYIRPDSNIYIRPDTKFDIRPDTEFNIRLDTELDILPDTVHPTSCRILNLISGILTDYLLVSEYNGDRRTSYYVAARQNGHAVG